MWGENNLQLQKIVTIPANKNTTTAITKTALHVHIPTSWTSGFLFCSSPCLSFLEKEAENVEEDLGSMVGSVYRTASQSRQVSMWLSSWVDLTELSFCADRFRSENVHDCMQNYVITLLLLFLKCGLVFYAEMNMQSEK